MCYHNTYLFSLCGHVTSSRRPTQHTAICKNVPGVQTLQSPRGASSSSGPIHLNLNSSPMRSSNSSLPEDPHWQARPSPEQPVASTRSSYPSSAHIIDVFPSPQEFEFAKQLHDSVPASPLSPNTTKQQQQENMRTTCPKTTRHPLCTYKIPLLCPTCQFQRDLNIAQFEAQAVKESVEREGRVRGVTSSRAGAGGAKVVEVGRKKISRRRKRGGEGEDCGLIPLICVEEGRIRRTEGAEGGDKLAESRGRGVDEERGTEALKDDHTGTGSARRFESTLSEEVLAIDAQAPTAPGAAVATDSQERVSHVLHTPSDSTTSAASSSWSWWGRTTALPKRAAAVTPEMTPPQLPSPPPTPPIILAKAQHDEPDTFVIDTGSSKISPVVVHTRSEPAGTMTLTSERIDWTHVKERWKGINNNVARDVFGRNLKGMNRIMGWDAGSDHPLGT